jgi:hypothetical protein
MIYILRNRNIHVRLHNNTLLDPIMSKFKPSHTFDFNIMFLSYYYVSDCFLSYFSA